MGVKDVALILRLRVVSPCLRPTSIQGYFFPNIKQISYREIRQSFFANKSIKRIKSMDEGVKMSGFCFKRMA